VLALQIALVGNENNGYERDFLSENPRSEKPKGQIEK
jgi:hypothetical protein